jgi:hypothetical protein
MNAPEQRIVNYLEGVGYSSDTIVAYLESSANAGRLNFSEGEFFHLDFAVCERPDGTRYGTAGECDPEKGKPVADSDSGKPGESKADAKKKKKEEEKKKEQTPEDMKQDKMTKQAKSQGSDPSNNRKVVIDGKEYGWAKKGEKWILVEWGSVAGVKKVGPKQAPAKPATEKSTRKTGTRRSSSRSLEIQNQLDKLQSSIQEIQSRI